MALLETRKLAAQWIAAQAISGSRTDEEWAPILEVINLANEDPEALWVVIGHIVELGPSELVKGALAAGPLEDLIQDHGSQFLARIEKQSKLSATFATLLPSVWVPESNDPVTQAYIRLGCAVVRAGV